MPQNPYLTPPPGAPPAPGGMDPAKMQRQQARTDRQNARTATQQMGQQVQTAMGQLPAQPVPQVSQPGMPQGAPIQQAQSAMGQQYDQMSQALGPQPQANLMQTHFPGGPPPPSSGQASGFAGPVGTPSPTQAPMQSAQPAGPSGTVGGFQPRQMLRGVQGASRGAAMESMARPSAVRSAFKQAQTTGAVPGVKPPKPPQY